METCSNDVGHGGNFLQNPASSHSTPNEDVKRKVSISQAAIQADMEKQKRNNSLISSKSNATISEASNNCYVNPTFQHCPSGKQYKKSVVSHKCQNTSQNVFKVQKQYL